MPSLNKVLLMGNLTRDPELRVTPKGTPICQFSLAINFVLVAGYPGLTYRSTIAAEMLARAPLLYSLQYAGEEKAADGAVR